MSSFASLTRSLGLGVILLASACSSSTSTDTGGGAGAPPDSSAAGAAGADDAPASPMAGSAGDDGTPGSSAAGEGSGDASPLSCMGVLQCAGECPDEGVDDCVGACVERTRPSSQAVTAAFLRCLIDNQCADATCIQAMCTGELSACASDDTSEIDGTPATGPTPTGNVPADLVGLWSTVGLTSGTSYEISADGTTIQAFSMESNYGCALKTQLTSSGVTTVDGDSLVYHRLEGTLATRTCGTVTTKPAEPADIAYRYRLGSNADGDPELSLYRVSDDGSVADSPLVLHH